MVTGLGFNEWILKVLMEARYEIQPDVRSHQHYCHNLPSSESCWHSSFNAQKNSTSFQVLSCFAFQLSPPCPFSIPLTSHLRPVQTVFSALKLFPEIPVVFMSPQVLSSFLHTDELAGLEERTGRKLIVHLYITAIILLAYD